MGNYVRVAQLGGEAGQDLAHQGIDVFCVGLDSGGENYLPGIFGRRGFLMIDRVEALPENCRCCISV